MFVLALDTSTPVLTAGVADVSDGSFVVVAERSLTDPFAHAEQLMPLLEQALAEAGRSLREAGAVVVGLGPGPFTGLRVGIASAAALGDALDIPVHGIGSHRALAAGTVGDVLVVTDARRREVYVSAYRDGVETAGPAPVAPAAVAEWLIANGVTVTSITGPGAPLVADTLALPVQPPAVSLTEGLISAVGAGLTDGAVPSPLTPLYLRRPDATEPSATRKSVLGR